MEYSYIFNLERKSIPLVKGVYFLFKDGELVYIGQSCNIYSRLAVHLADKNFDQFSFIEVRNSAERIKKEKYLIQKFKPRYNKEVSNKEFVEYENAVPIEEAIRRMRFR